MLRSLGFLTGAALTAVLALALTDSLAIDGLRRSAEQLFTGTDRTRVAAVPPAAATLSLVEPPAPVAAMTGSDRPAEAGPQPHLPAAATVVAAVDDRMIDKPSATGRRADGKSDTDASDSSARAAEAEDGAAALADALTVGPPDPSPPGPAAAAGNDRPTTEPSEPSPAADGTDAPPDEVPVAPKPETDRPVRAPTPAPGATLEETRLAAPGARDLPPALADPDAGPPVSATGESGGWHAFWTPFHSEASAAGFARHLNRATGEDYRVIKTGPGEYRVAFWHAGEDERSRQLLAIERASGLSLRGGEL